MTIKTSYDIREIIKELEENILETISNVEKKYLLEVTNIDHELSCAGGEKNCFECTFWVDDMYLLGDREY